MECDVKWSLSLMKPETKDFKTKMSNYTYIPQINAIQKNALERSLQGLSRRRL